MKVAPNAFQGELLRRHELEESLENLRCADFESIIVPILISFERERGESLYSAASRLSRTNELCLARRLAP
jgi:hypothetical protein